jgi:hypothetical protein
VYIIEEWQGQNENSMVAIVPPVQKADYYEAEGEYLIKQGYACMSSVPYHVVRLSDHTGFVVMHHCYTPERLARFNQPEGEQQEGGGTE